MFVTLTSRGRRADRLLPYDAVDASSGWLNRVRSVHDVSPDLLHLYLPLACATFSRLCVHDRATVDSSWIVSGDVGLGLALDEQRRPVQSVEAAALFQLVQTSGAPDRSTHLESLRDTWASGQCLVMHLPLTGWRGCFAEHRLWSAVLVSKGKTTKTPHAKPMVRAWAPTLLLEDLMECIGEEVVHRVASKVAELGFDGAPDLLLYRRTPATLWFVEVKSATDNLRPNQVAMLRELERLSDARCLVRCKVCCPAETRKRHLHALESYGDDDSD